MTSRRAGLDGSAAGTAAGPLLIAVAAAGLAVLAFRFHPIGDYFTESDFYGAYARGAAGIQHGHFEAWRYGVYGPAYEALLALAGAIAGGLFAGARVLSVAAATAVLAAAWWAARRRHGPFAALTLVALLAVNPTFVRYGYSATSDMTGFALFTLAAALLIAGSGDGAALGAGAAAGLATLTRYNLGVLLPAGLIVLAIGRPRVERRGALLRFAAAFALVTLPFALWATLQGHPPGAVLAQDAGFYLNDAPQVALEERVGHPDGSATPAAHANLPRLLARLSSGLPAHLVADASTLLGWPAVALALAGLAWLLVRRRAAPLLPAGVLALAVLLPLAPLFYSERYSMVVLPLVLLPAAAALAEPAGRAARWLRTAAALAVVALTLRACVALQREEYASIPVEALGAGEVLRSLAHPGERVLARKAHVAWVAGLEPVLFPDCPSLDSLARFCRAKDVHYLYYGWFEARLRPRFRYLLDTAAAVPGLTPLHATIEKPSATYAIGPGFGSPPEWAFDAERKREIAERVDALMAPPR
jgi:hypothetical protein